MADDLARLFERWRRTGDAAALAEVFDRTAPELLRVALHVCGNPSDAEDLLQSTILSALESAERFDASRPLVPWLVAILTNRARAEVRRGKRQVDTLNWPPDIATELADPARCAADNDAVRAVLSELDRLPEPYRQPTILRVRHGMEPADIAHVLERSPSTVRGQVRRGLALLRRALPAGVASAIAITLTAPRGLAAIRDCVLARAEILSATTTATTSGVAAGGALMAKKLITGAVIAAAVIVAATLATTKPWTDTPQDVDVARAPISTTAPKVKEAEQSGPDSGARQTPERATVESSNPRSASSVMLRARVIDGATRAPIERAAVAAFGPRRASMLELAREFSDRLRWTPTGGVTSNLEHLQIENAHALPIDVTFGGAPLEVLVPPQAGILPHAKTETDRDGRFELEVPQSGAMLALRSEDYGERLMPLQEFDGEETTIELWRTRTIRGRIVTEAGQELPRVRLRFTDATLPAKGAWDATTDATGTFEAEIATEVVRATCMTPGWVVSATGRPAGGIRTSISPYIEAGEQNATLLVKPFGGARIRVIDAVTRAAIETVHVIARNEHGFPKRCGRFWAPDGYLNVSGWDANEVVGQTDIGMFGQTLDLVVWSDGHDPSEVRFDHVFQPGDNTIEVPLTRGGLATLHGRVLRGGTPEAGAIVQVRAYHHLNWNHSRSMVVDRVVAQPDGSFELRAPRGSYLLEAHSAGEDLRQPIDVPHSAPIVLDFGDRAAITVTVVDGNGNPLPDHNVAAHGSGGESKSGFTDAAGKCTLEPLRAGNYKVAIPRTATKGSWVADLTEDLQLGAGEQRDVRFVVAQTGPRRVCLVFDGDAPAHGFEGFSIRGVFPAVEPEDVGVDGQCPIEFAPGRQSIEVRAPGGRSWHLRLPKDEQPLHEVSIRWMGAAYEGFLTDERGKPVRHARVSAKCSGNPDVSAQTDDTGSFRIEGLDAAKKYSLSFAERSDAPHAGYSQNRLEKCTFIPSAPPSTDPTVMRIRLPAFVAGTFRGRDRIEVTGVLSDGRSGEPLVSAIVSIHAFEQQEGGTLQLFAVSGWKHTDNSGRFEIAVPRGERYVATFYSRGNRDLRGTDEWKDDGGTRYEREIVLR